MLCKYTICFQIKKNIKTSKTGTYTIRVSLQTPNLFYQLDCFIHHHLLTMHFGRPGSTKGICVALLDLHIIYISWNVKLVMKHYRWIICVPIISYNEECRVMVPNAIFSNISIISIRNKCKTRHLWENTLHYEFLSIYCCPFIAEVSFESRNLSSQMLDKLLMIFK